GCGGGSEPTSSTGWPPWRTPSPGGSPRWCGPTRRCGRPSTSSSPPGRGWRASSTTPTPARRAPRRTPATSGSSRWTTWPRGSPGDGPAGGRRAARAVGLGARPHRRHHGRAVGAPPPHRRLGGRRLRHLARPRPRGRALALDLRAARRRVQRPLRDPQPGAVRRARRHPLLRARLPHLAGGARQLHAAHPAAEHRRRAGRRAPRRPGGGRRHGLRALAAAAAGRPAARRAGHRGRPAHRDGDHGRARDGDGAGGHGRLRRPHQRRAVPGLPDADRRRRRAVGRPRRGVGRPLRRPRVADHALGPGPGGGRRRVRARGGGDVSGALGDMWDYLRSSEAWSGRNGLPALAWAHLRVSAVAVLVAAAVAIPAGVLLGHVKRGALLAVSVVNIGRAVPSFAVLALLLPFSLRYGFGLGFWPTIVALVLLAVPPIFTNTYTGVRDVPADAVEAAQGMGMRGGELVRRVELPVALPLVLTGLRVSA